jgi:hypothetical protein
MQRKNQSKTAAAPGAAFCSVNDTCVGVLQKVCTVRANQGVQYGAVVRVQREVCVRVGRVGTVSGRDWRWRHAAVYNASSADRTPAIRWYSSSMSVVMT